LPVDADRAAQEVDAILRQAKQLAWAQPPVPVPAITSAQ
jgi:hypothetical protein